MQLHELKSSSPRPSAKRIGRGGKRGKTSGRGTKGQKARTGNSTRPEMREQIKKLPKLRGHGKNRARTVNAEKMQPIVINVSKLETTFPAGATISPKTLLTAGIITVPNRKLVKVKILGTGDVTKKYIVEGCLVSDTAKAKLEAVGGKVS